LDHQGRILTDKVSHEVLTKQLQPLERAVARQVVKQQRDLVDGLVRQALQECDAQMPTQKASALATWQKTNQAEIERLVALAAINPAIRPVEIEALQQRLVAGEQALNGLRAVAHAVRLIVAA
jgi:ATP-dependent helicase HepA